MENKEDKKIKTRKVRTRNKTSQAVKDKISLSMKKYWANVIYTDEDGNIIPRDKDKSEDKK